jgi:hypothetical protein
MNFDQLVERTRIDFFRETNNLMKANLALSHLLLESTSAFTAETKGQVEALAQLVRTALQVKAQLQDLAPLREQMAQLKHLAAARLQALKDKIIRLKVGNIEQELERDCEVEETAMSLEHMEQLLKSAGVDC